MHGRSTKQRRAALRRRAVTNGWYRGVNRTVYPWWKNKGMILKDLPGTLPYNGSTESINLKEFEDVAKRRRENELGIAFVMLVASDHDLRMLPEEIREYWGTHA